MSDQLDLLENQVVQSRQRLHDDLANLRRPGLANLKSDVSASANNVLEDIKDRLAANPLATVAIGAGVAWRLAHRPPVASLLVGYGLYSLLRTDPRQPSPLNDYARQAQDYARQASERASDYARQAVATGSALADRATHLAEETRTAAAAGLNAARETATETWDKISASATDAGTRAAQAVAEGAETVTQQATQARDAVMRDKDMYLLGFAAAALATAVGISAQRAARR